MTADILVLGGGPAGCASAIQLARAGRQVTLVERERAPAHKVCGEFLSGEALIYLQDLGVNAFALGALPLRHVRLARRNSTIEQPLPFAAMSLTRRCLDSELLRVAERAGVNVQRGCAVERLVSAGSNWQASLASGEQITATSVFLASGKHDLRGHPRPAGKQRGMVAFKMYWKLNADQTHALGNAVELCPYEGGYAGLQPVEGNVANLCCLIHTDVLRRIGGKWHHLLEHMCQHSPHLRNRLREAEPCLPKPLTIAAIPYGFVRRTSDSFWYVGDQAVVIPSFTGDGMSLALHTGLLAAEMFLKGRSANSYQQLASAHVKRQVAFATAVSKAIVRFPRVTTAVAGHWPAALKRIARATRIAPRAILSPEHAVMEPGR